MRADLRRGEPRNARRAGLAAFVGTTIEWYDFFVFTTAAGLVFGKVFFPELSPGVGALASFATLWVGYFGRPLGGLLFGHIGDRLGRKKALIATLVMMGCCTTAIGVLPTAQQIGAVAPVILALLRIVQGIALGGEWGGAVLIASESAPKERSVSFGNFAQQGTPAGSILSTLAFILVATLPAPSFVSWGWRLPFLFSAVLVAVGLFVRLRVEDPPEFAEARRKNQLAKVPALDLIRGSTGILVLGVGVCAVGVGMSGMKNPFLLSWTTGQLHVGRSTMLNILLWVTVVQFVAQPVAAWLSTRIGVRKVMVGSLLATLVLLGPIFLSIGTGVPGLVALGFIVFMMVQSGYYAVLAGFLSTSAFPVRVRYTGISLSYQLAGSIFGAIPVCAQLLLNATGSVWLPVVFYAAIVALTLGCVVALARPGARTEEPQVLIGGA